MIVFSSAGHVNRNAQRGTKLQKLFAANGANGANWQLAGKRHALNAPIRGDFALVTNRTVPKPSM
jgi:hypothetical protein